VKTCIKNLLLLPVLTAGLTLIPPSQITAQTFTTLYNFTATSGPYPYTNSDGAGPLAGLILAGNTLYGTARGGGSSANGTVFALNTNGTGLTTLHSFTTGGYNSSSDYTNSGGAGPEAGLILSGNTLFGVVKIGGR
jgi:uncharacterized repeat protein (TIGR03803 family)